VLLQHELLRDALADFGRWPLLVAPHDDHLAPRNRIAVQRQIRRNGRIGTLPNLRLRPGIDARHPDFERRRIRGSTRKPKRKRQNTKRNNPHR
jgi:hypothetical protein